LADFIPLRLRERINRFWAVFPKTDVQGNISVRKNQAFQAQRLI